MLIIVFSIALIIVLIILIITLVLFYKDSRYKPPAPVVKRREVGLEECTIEELAERIAGEDLDEAKLLKVVDLIGRKHTFPKKTDGKAPKEVEPYMDFVYQFCMNTSATAKVIVKMSNTLKAINEQYKREIEDIERTAIRDLDSKAAES
ncbi:MAG: hypothetical protein OEW60_07535 [Thiovulaceae bacterium]|nr:hypothetical protein [Sulfurimonadaceae bacterium]